MPPIETNALEVVIEIDCELPEAQHEEDPLQVTSEIELTAEQMDAMLEGRWPF